MDLDRTYVHASQPPDTDVVLLAGFMKKLGPHTLRTYAGRISHTPPRSSAEIGGPGMFGAHRHRAVLSSGDRCLVRPCT